MYISLYHIFYLFLDVNECLIDTDGCNHICTNVHCLDGQYVCSCYEGYNLTDSEHICAGMNYN